MASNDRLPPELDCSNLAKEWQSWKRQFLVYMIAKGKMDESEQQKIATFLWLIGARAGDIYNTLYPNDGTPDGIFGVVQAAPIEQNANAQADANAGEILAVQVRTLDNVLKAFDDYCLPRKNIAMETFKFNTITQKDKQTFADFETELRTQLHFCEFNCDCGVKYEHRMLRDRIIIGVHDKKLQLKLLDGKDDPLKKVIETCKIYEAANANRNLLDRRVSQSNVNAVQSDEKNEANVCNAVTRHCFNCGCHLPHRIYVYAKQMD